MRNALADDVLNKNMLHLMEVYETTLGDKGARLSGTIELLRISETREIYMTSLIDAWLRIKMF